MVHVASSSRSRGSKAEDDRFDGVGCDVVEVRPKYPSLTIISFSALRNILVFFVGPINRIKGVVGWLSLLQSFILQLSA
jgi:hypothetical protein